MSLRYRGYFVPSGVPPSGITVTGTAIPTQTEAEVVLGGKTIILTIAGDTFVTGTSSLDGIAGGSDSDIAASGTNWDSLIKTALDNTDVVLSVGDTVATITLPAFGTYDIPGTETITWTIPARTEAGQCDDVGAPYAVHPPPEQTNPGCGRRGSGGRSAFRRARKSRR